MPAGYIGIGGKAKKIKGIYLGVGGVAKKVKKAYIGVGGVAKLWYQAMKIPTNIQSLTGTARVNSTIAMDAIDDTIIVATSITSLRLINGSIGALGNTITLTGKTKLQSEISHVGNNFIYKCLGTDSSSTTYYKDGRYINLSSISKSGTVNPCFYSRNSNADPRSGMYGIGLSVGDCCLFTGGRCSYSSTPITNYTAAKGMLKITQELNTSIIATGTNGLALCGDNIGITFNNKAFFYPNRSHVNGSTNYWKGDNWSSNIVVVNSSITQENDIDMSNITTGDGEIACNGNYFTIMKGHTVASSQLRSPRGLDNTESNSIASGERQYWQSRTHFTAYTWNSSGTQGQTISVPNTAIGSYYGGYDDGILVAGGVYAVAGDYDDEGDRIYTWTPTSSSYIIDNSLSRVDSLDLPVASGYRTYSGYTTKLKNGVNINNEKIYFCGNQFFPHSFLVTLT